MSIIRPVTVPSLTNVAANQTFTLQVPVGVLKYLSFDIVLGGAIVKSDITNLSMEINGKTIQLFKTIADLEMLSAYYGYPIKADRITVQLSRDHLEEAREALGFAFGAADIDTFQIKGDIGDVVGGFTLSATTEKWIDDTDGLEPGNLRARNSFGRITKIKNFSDAATAAGPLQIDRLPREQFIAAVHLVSDQILSCAVELDSVKVWDLDVAGMEAHVEKRNNRVRQANVYHIDFLTFDEIGTELPVGNRANGRGVDDMRFNLEMAGAGQVGIIVEYLSGFGGI